MNRFWRTVLMRAAINFLSPWTIVCALLALTLWRCLPYIESASYNLSLSAWSANQTVEALNAPCKDLQGDYECGPIRQLAQTEKNIGIVAAKAAQQVQQSATLINSSTAAIQQASQSVSGVAQHVQGTADAATGLMTSVKVDADTLQPTLLGLQRIPHDVDATSQGVNLTLQKFDALLDRPSIGQTLDGLGATSKNLGDISADFQLRFHAILFPPPCRSFGCFLGQRLYPALKDGAELGSSAYQVSTWFRAIPIHVEH
jgi:hypothetical protein